MDIDDPIFDGLVQVRLSFDAARQAGRVGPIVRRWFDDGWRELGGSVREWLIAEPPAGAVVRHGVDVRATAAVPGGEEEVFFESSMGRWGDFLDGLAADSWALAAMRAGATDGGGAMLPFYRAADYWVAYLNRDTVDGRDLVQLTVQSTETCLYGPAAGEEAVAGFVERMVGACDADYAEAGFGYGGLGTVVDSTTYTHWGASAAAAREVLRGYSWLTFVPAPLVPKVGGVAGLRESGAFAQVTEVPGGGVLLRATEHFGDYRNEEAARVFDVLQPVLRPGTRASAFRSQVEARGM